MVNALHDFKLAHTFDLLRLPYKCSLSVVVRRNLNHTHTHTRTHARTHLYR